MSDLRKSSEIQSFFLSTEIKFFNVFKEESYMADKPFSCIFIVKFFKITNSRPILVENSSHKPKVTICALS